MTRFWPKSHSGPGNFAEIAENVIECGDKAIDLLLAYNQGREDLYDVGVVGGDLSKDSVFLKKRSDDHLGEEPLVHCVDGFPSEFEFQRARFLKLDGDHQAFAADFRDNVVFFPGGREVWTSAVLLGGRHFQRGARFR